MIVKNLTVGKGLQAYRLFSQPPTAAPIATDTPGLTTNEVHRMFYDRLMSASEGLLSVARPQNQLGLTSSTDPEHSQTV
jgi:hypothetical protein